MKVPRNPIRFGDLGILVLIALAKIVLHLIVNGQYGFHRDELATLDDARYLAWGYVAYPPATPFIARVGLEMFGPSLVGIRFFAALAQSAAIVLTGLMTRELGGPRWAQVLSALAAAISPLSLLSGALFQYVSFDYLWWVLIAFLAIKLLKSEDARWWIPIGCVIGLGMMTKYTMAFLAVGIVAGVVFTRARRFLTSPWLWGGVGLSLLIFLPNLVWQVRHDFISLQFLSAIHARDVRIGRTGGYLIEQLFVAANPFMIPLWVAGLYYYFVAAAGRHFRMLGWLYLTPFLLFMVMRGRSYYLAPAYPMLFAAGAIIWHQWVAGLPRRSAGIAAETTWGGLVIGGLIGSALMLPVAPVNSWLWNVTARVHDNFAEEIGWQDLARTVAGIYAALPENEKSRAGILAGNYGEAGAIDLYGPAYGLPKAISGTNSYWQRGYGNPPPETVIVLGFSQEDAARIFESCELVGHVTNRYGVRNEESVRHPDIFVCRRPRRPWPELWSNFRRFG